MRASGMPKLRVLVRLKKSTRKLKLVAFSKKPRRFRDAEICIADPVAAQNVAAHVNRSGHPGHRSKVAAIRVHGARVLKSELPPARRSSSRWSCWKSEGWC